MKIVLKTNKEMALFLFSENPTEPFVIGTLDLKDKNKRVGEEVDSWYNGKYFRNIKDAIISYDKLLKRMEEIR